MYKTYTGFGSQSLTWNGLLNGVPVPESKYTLTLKNAKGKTADTAQVGVDMTPPEISYEIMKTATGRKLDTIKIIIKDPQTGIAHSETEVENISGTADSGLPQIIKETKTENNTSTKQILTFDLTNPDLDLYPQKRSA